MDATLGLMLIIALFGACIFLMLITLMEADSEKRRLQVENRDLYRKNYRLDWDNNMLLAERKQISAEHGLRLPPFRCSQKPAMTQCQPIAKESNHG